LGVASDNISVKQSHPAIKSDSRVQGITKTTNKDSYKETKKTMKAYDKASTTDIDGGFIPPKNEVDSVDDNLGMEDLKYDNTNKIFTDKQKDNIKGSSETGNEDTDATEMNGDVKNPKFGEDLIKRIKAKAKRNIKPGYKGTLGNEYGGPGEVLRVIVILVKQV